MWGAYFAKEKSLDEKSDHNVNQNGVLFHHGWGMKRQHVASIESTCKFNHENLGKKWKMFSHMLWRHSLK